MPTSGLSSSSTPAPVMALASGFKEDSEVGEALRAGHAVYFVSFFPDPVPGQTLGDVAAAEEVFLKEVAARHPKAGKPVVVGNCQGG